MEPMEERTAGQGQLERADPGSALALLQGSYDVATGIWPVVHLRSFEKVSGPKADGWLVKMVGLLFTVGGVVLIGSALSSLNRGRKLPMETVALGVGLAVAPTIIDTVYVAKRRISPVYLLDALIELPLIAGWLLTRRKPR